jgi:hypothetical protein
MSRPVMTDWSACFFMKVALAAEFVTVQAQGHSRRHWGTRHGPLREGQIFSHRGARVATPPAARVAGHAGPKAAGRTGPAGHVGD